MNPQHVDDLAGKDVLIEYKTVVYLDDAEDLLRRVVEIANQTAPP